MPHKILLVHNEYHYRGGETSYVQAQKNLLLARGHEVYLLEKHNDQINQQSLKDLLYWGINSVWSAPAQAEMRSHIRNISPQIVHVHNFFPLWSPAIHQAIKQQGIPTVQHLHNYRLGCLNACLFRNAQVCELCVGKNPWRGLFYRCYRNSLPASLAVWLMLTFNRWRKTWHRDVDLFLVPSLFTFHKLVEIGLPADKMRLLPNFIPKPQIQATAPPKEPSFLFVGRLSAEKGVMNLLEIWRRLNEPSWQLTLVGEGELLPTVRLYIAEHQLGNIKLLGRQNQQVVQEEIAKASAIILPSIFYETFGLAVAEAFALGRPALVSNHGALAEVVKDGETGFCLPYDQLDLWVERIRWCGDNLSKLAVMGNAAKAFYSQNFTPEVHYSQLISIYSELA
jgi:glycosyltransferase involved in cell wall biosynthesis